MHNKKIEAEEPPTILSSKYSNTAPSTLGYRDGVGASGKTGMHMGNLGDMMGGDLTMSIKQEETIEQILQQTTQSGSVRAKTIRQQQMRYSTSYPKYLPLETASYEMDEDIDRLLKESEIKIGEQYDSLAREQFARNRIGITINDEHDRLKQIFDRMDAARSQISMTDSHIHSENHQGEGSELERKMQPFSLDLTKLKLNYQTIDDCHLKKKTPNRMRSQSTNLLSFEDQPSSNESMSDETSQSAVEETEAHTFQWHQMQREEVQEQEDILQRFQREQILHPKPQQTWELDQRYPRINPSSMYRHQYPIFKFAESSTTKYIRYLRKPVNEIQCALSFFANTTKWTILAIDGLIYIFVGDQWKQPIIINPRPSHKEGTLKILGISLSKTNSYFSVSLETQILIYQIKTQTNSVVLVRNLSANNDMNTQLTHVNKISIYSENPLKLAYLDSQKIVGLISCEQIMLFSRVSDRRIEHDLEMVLDMDVLVMESQVVTSSPVSDTKFKFSLNKKIASIRTKPKTTYMAMSSSSELQVYRVEPNVALLHRQSLGEKKETEVSVRWRYQQQAQSKPQLLLAQNNKIYIYKLIEQQQDNVEDVFLHLHLVYENHYDIKLMEIISNTHLLLLSNSNIIVVAIPLIPSSDLGQGGLRKNSGCGQEMFESAIVFIASQQECRILYACQEEVIFCSGKAEALKVANLKSLQQYIDELMLQQGQFREAFTLLILVHKGVNYSFKFSYTKQSLAHSIFSAVQYTISSLRLTINDDIIKYRLGWICQLLVETHNESMIWTTVYKKIKEKQTEREKEWLAQAGTYNKQTEHSNSSSHLEIELERKKVEIWELDKIKSTSKQNEKEQKKAKFWSRHSLVTEQTNSSELRGEAPKNLLSSLFDILELFIIKSQIDSMPESIFLQFISYQCEKMSDAVVEKAIIQNKQPYDGAKLLTLLQNKQRNYLQLYLFSRAIICDEADFYTPFVKVFASFKKQAETIQKRKRGVDEDLGTKMKNTGYLCLWYLCKCLKFQKIPSGIMPLNEKQAIVHTMCVQILEPMITQKLFELDPKLLLEVFLLYFTDRDLSQLLQENNEGLVQRYKQYYPSIYQQIMSKPQSQTGGSVRDSVQQIFEKSFKQLVLLHLEKTIPLLSNQKQLWAEFQAVAFYHSKTQVCLSFEAVVDILIVLFESKFKYFRMHNYSRHSYRPSVESLELALIDYIKPVLILRKDRFYINKLISFNDKHVSYYLYRIDQNYKQALDHYISLKQSRGLISFIHDLLADIEDMACITQSEKIFKQKKIAEVKSFLVRNINTVFKIDKFQALEIFYRIGETSQTIYQLIEENMGNKLNFITAVLKKFEHEDFQMKEKFQLEHLSEVCMLGDKQMLSYLNQFYYPLDSAIIVCEQKGNLLAKAIFQERCGRITDAFMSYERIVKNIIQSNTLPSKSSSEKSIRKKVHKYTEECLRLCKHYAYDPNSSPQNNFWFRIITFINGFIKSNNQHKVFLKVEFEKVLQHILSEMFQFLPTTFLTDFFIARGHKLELSKTKEFVIYQNLFILAKFDIEVAKKVIEICKIDIKDTRKETLFKRKNGVVSEGFCDFCKKPLHQQQNCHAYSCRHSFHKICHDDAYKCLTCYFESDNSLFKTNIFGAEFQKNEGKLEIKYSDNKSSQTERKMKSMQNIHVIVESAQLAKQELIKKRMKLFDYNEQTAGDRFYRMVELYNPEENKTEKQLKVKEMEKEDTNISQSQGRRRGQKFQTPDGSQRNEHDRNNFG